MTSLLIPASESRLEGVYGWLEARRGAKVELWGREYERRCALLAYSDGGDDTFGWSNWASKAYQDPSALLQAFDQVEIVVDDEAGAALQSAFPGAFQVGAASNAG